MNIMLYKPFASNQSHGFVALCVLQALIFMTTFCGFAVYQAQKISQAQVARAHALSNRSLLLVMAGLVADAMSNDVCLALHMRIHGGCIDKKIVARVIASNDANKTVRVELIGERDKAISALYLFFNRKNKNEAWLYRGMQFGSAL
jgi:hypothetical protein